MGTEVTTIAQTRATGNPLTLKELRSFEAATRGWPVTTEWGIQNTPDGPIITALIQSVQP